ncbi:nSTAND1 domain-containing NTPase [Methylomonas sp. MgM2]
MPEFHEVTRPYPGLRPFESWEGEIFFGREEHTNRLLDILQQQHFLAVIGPSGSGKSSLVRAGLLPALPLGSIGTGSDWRTAVLRPGNRPMQRLALALLGSAALGVELVGSDRFPNNTGRPTNEVALIEAELRRGPLGLAEVVKEARSHHAAAEPFNLLVVVDQFEEIFTYAEAGAHQADESEAFVNLLLAQRAEADQRIYIVLTMRTDFLGNCVRFLDLPDAINRAQYLTPRLTREQSKSAIIGPARLFDGDVEPSLVDEMINAVGYDPDQLPILQHALARMWERAESRKKAKTYITWGDFNGVGGVSNALSKHANEILASLSPKGQIETPLSPNQRAAEILFRAITELRVGDGGGQAVRRPQSLRQVALWSDKDWQAFLPVIHAFADQNVNFIHYVGELNEDTVIDISHEALIRQWELLKEWVNDESQMAREYRRWRERAEAKASGAGALLAGADLARAIEWREGSARNTQSFSKPGSAWATRYSRTPINEHGNEFGDVLKFIEDSEQVVLRAKRRERRIKLIMVGLTIMSLAATVVATLFSVQARDRLIASEAAGLWHPLDFSEDDLNITEKRALGLLRLARSDASHQQAFLEQLLRGEALASWFNSQSGLVLSAAVGLNLQRRNWFIERLHEIPFEAEQKKSLVVARSLALLELDGDVRADMLIAALQVAQGQNQIDALISGLTAVVSDGVGESQIPKAVASLIAAIQSEQPGYSKVALGQGLVTAIGKMPASEAELTVEELMEVIQESSDLKQLDALAQGLVAAARKVPEGRTGTVTDTLMIAFQAAPYYVQQAAIAQGLAALLGNNLSESQTRMMVDALVAPLQTVGDDEALALGKALAAVVGKTTGNQVQTITEMLIAELQAAYFKGQMVAIGKGLEVVAGRLPENLTFPLIRKLTIAHQTTYSFEQQEAFGKALVTMAGMVPESQTETVTEQLIGLLQAENVSSVRQVYLGNALSAVARKLPESSVGAVSDKLMLALRIADQYEQQEAVGKGLETVAAKVPERFAQRLTDKLIDELENRAKSSVQMVVLGSALEAAAGKLPETVAESVTDRLIGELKSLKYTEQRVAVCRGLVAAAGKIPADGLKKTADNMIGVIRESSNSDQLSVLGNGLAGVAARVPENQVNALVNELVAGIETSQDSAHLIAFSLALAALSGELPDFQVESVTDNLMAVLRRTSDYGESRALGLSAANVARYIADDQQAASVLFELLKNPLLPRDALTDAIRKRFPDAPSKDQGFWVLIEWADRQRKENRFPNLDLASPLKPPIETAASQPARIQ